MLGGRVLAVGERSCKYEKGRSWNDSSGGLEIVIDMTYSFQHMDTEININVSTHVQIFSSSGHCTGPGNSTPSPPQQEQ